MGIFKQDDPGYWQASPEFLKTLQDACDPYGLRIVHFLLGPADNPDSAAAAILEMPPGYELPRHAHNCERFEVIVKGSLQVGEQTLYPGDVATSATLEMYGPHVAGPEGCTTVEVFGALRGVGHTIFDTPDGPSEVVYLGADGQRGDGDRAGRD